MTASHTTSLRFRITVLVITAIVLILGTATLMIDIRVDSEVAQRADTNLLERAQALANIFTTHTTLTSQPFPSHRIPSFLADDGTVYFRIDCRGQHVVSADDAARLDWPTLAAGQRMAFADIVGRRGTDLRAVTLRFALESRFTRSLASAKPIEDSHLANSESACELGLAVDHSEVLDFQESMDHIEFGSVVVGFLVVAVLAPLLVMGGLRPLSGLVEAMKKIGPDAPNVRLESTRIRELEPLTARFNEVLSRMEEGLQRERQFASGVAHELRTPLAELRTVIEVEMRFPSGRDPHELLADIGQIGAKMERIVTALLMLTRIEAGIEKLSLQPVDVSALTHTLIERHRVQERTLTLQADVAPGVIWMADPTLLDVLLGNLLGNALAYAPAGCTVRLHCASSGWSVINPAPELSAQDIIHMKQRFWRKGSHAGVHTGLGLALSASAARAQSLKLELFLRDENLQASVTPPHSSA
jgi:signal transduction histidine kinase